MRSLRRVAWDKKRHTLKPSTRATGTLQKSIAGRYVQRLITADIILIYFYILLRSSFFRPFFPTVSSPVKCPLGTF